MRNAARVLAFLLLISALNSPHLPASAQEIQPQIPLDDRIRIAEAFRLGEELQEQVWKGWSEAPFAVLLVTQEYEFLIRHPQPSEDFTFLRDDPELKSKVYYRKRQFPPSLLATFPAVGGISTIVVGQLENTNAGNSTHWVVTLLHEHFHQWQDSQPDFYKNVNALGLARGDQSGMWMLNFPFPYERPDVDEKFQALSGALVAALEARGKPEFTKRLDEYLAARHAFQQVLAPDDYKYLSFQLWKEGVARYTEYRIARLAGQQFKPTAEFAALPDYVPFASDADATLQRTISQLKKAQLAKSKREIFYAVGAGEALLLDEANPAWQAGYMREKFALEGHFPQATGH